MNPAMYIFINKGLGMSAGKVGAQAGHAAVEAYRISCGLDPHQPQEDRVARENAVTRHWYKGGHYAKYIMEADDQDQLFAIQNYLFSRGFKSTLIVDEGHTEGTRFVATALGVEVVDKAHPHVAATFGEFKLYKAPHSVVVLEANRRVDYDTWQEIKALIEAGKDEEAQERLRSQRPKRHLWRR